MYMNVKEGQLKEHVKRHCAISEAQRLANSLNCKIYTVKIETAIIPSSPHNHGGTWTKILDKKLLYKFMSGNFTPRELGVYFGRTAWSICCRLERYKLSCSKDNTYRGW